MWQCVVVSGIFSVTGSGPILEKKIEKIMENIKYSIRSSQIFGEIKSIKTENLSNVLCAAKQLGFCDVDYVQIKKNVYDVWCDSTIQNRMEWRLTVTLNCNN